MNYFWIFAVLNCVAATPFSPCKSGVLFPDVEIPGCTEAPCTFYLGGLGSMNMKFRAPKYLEHFMPNAVAEISGIEVPYPLGQDDGCVGVTNTPCPLAENEYVEYTYEMLIFAFFPEVILTLEFSLVDKDQNNEPFICFRVPLKIAKP